MSDKSFKTIDEQIEILRNRGLAIEDESFAKDFLLRNNYYRVSGYSLTLRSHDVFNVNATFQNIVDIYNFDHELRHILLEYIELIEVSIKSIFAYEFTKRHGSTGYTDPRYFTDPVKHAEIMKKAEKQKIARLPHEAYLKHFVEDLNQEIPLWAYVDLLTISDISFLYKISELDIKNAVALIMGLNTHGAEILQKYMHSMTIIRNLCAHGSRLYNRLFEQKPSLNKRDFALLLRTNTGSVDNSHLFGFILIMRRLLKYNDFITLKNMVFDLTKKYPFVNLRFYGFPDHWLSSI